MRRSVRVDNLARGEVLRRQYGQTLANMGKPSP
jgi:hypothetical protein